MDIIIALTIVILLVIAFEVYRAHTHNTSVQLQAKADLQRVEQKAQADLQAVKTEIALLREHFAAHTGTPIGTGSTPPPAPPTQSVTNPAV